MFFSVNQEYSTRGKSQSSEQIQILFSEFQIKILINI